MLGAMMQAAIDHAERGEAEGAAAKACEVWRAAPKRRLFASGPDRCWRSMASRPRLWRSTAPRRASPNGAWEANWNLGRFVFSAGHHEQGVAYLMEAVRIEPRAIQAHIDLGAWLSEMGQTREAGRRNGGARWIRSFDQELLDGPGRDDGARTGALGRVGEKRGRGQHGLAQGWMLRELHARVDLGKRQLDVDRREA